MHNVSLFFSGPLSVFPFLSFVLCVDLTLTRYFILVCVTDIPAAIVFKSVVASRGTVDVTSTIYSFITCLGYAGWPIQQDFANVIFLLKHKFWIS